MTAQPSALPFTMGQGTQSQGGLSKPPRTTQQKLQRLTEMSPFQGPPMQGIDPAQQPMLAPQQPAGQPALQPPMPFQAGQLQQGSGQQPMAAAPQQPIVQAPYQQPILQAPLQQPTLQAPPTYAVPPRSRLRWGQSRHTCHQDKVRDIPLSTDPLSCNQQFRRGNLFCLASGMTRQATCRRPQRDYMRTM